MSDSNLIANLKQAIETENILIEGLFIDKKQIEQKIKEHQERRSKHQQQIINLYEKKAVE